MSRATCHYCGGIVDGAEARDEAFSAMREALDGILNLQPTDIAQIEARKQARAALSLAEKVSPR